MKPYPTTRDWQSLLREILLYFDQHDDRVRERLLERAQEYLELDPDKDDDPMAFVQTDHLDSIDDMFACPFFDNLECQHSGPLEYLARKVKFLMRPGDRILFLGCQDEVPRASALIGNSVRYQSPWRGSGCRSYEYRRWCEDQQARANWWETTRGVLDSLPTKDQKEDFYRKAKIELEISLEKEARNNKARVDGLQLDLWRGYGSPKHEQIQEQMARDGDVLAESVEVSAARKHVLKAQFEKAKAEAEAEREAGDKIIAETEKKLNSLDPDERAELDALMKETEAKMKADIINTVKEHRKTVATKHQADGEKTKEKGEKSKKGKGTGKRAAKDSSQNAESAKKAPTSTDIVDINYQQACKEYDEIMWTKHDQERKDFWQARADEEKLRTQLKKFNAEFWMNEDSDNRWTLLEEYEKEMELLVDEDQRWNSAVRLWKLRQQHLIDETRAVLIDKMDAKEGKKELTKLAARQEVRKNIRQVLRRRVQERDPTVRKKMSLVFTFPRDEAVAKNNPADYFYGTVPPFDDRQEIKVAFKAARKALDQYEDDSRIKSIRSRSSKSAKWWMPPITLMMMAVAMCAFTAIPVAHGMTAFDCEDLRTKFAAIDLLETAPCPDAEKDFEEPRTVYAQILQVDSQYPISGFACKAAVSRRTTACGKARRGFFKLWYSLTRSQNYTGRRCGIHSDLECVTPLMMSHFLAGFDSLTYASRWSAWKEPINITPAECREMLQTKQFTYEDRIHELEEGAITSVQYFSHGWTSPSGHCDGATFTRDGETYEESYEETTIDIQVDRLRGFADLSNSRIRFNNGLHAPLQDEVLRDEFVGTLVWTAERPACEETISQIYIGNTTLHRKKDAEKLRESILMVDSDAHVGAFIVRERTEICQASCYSTQLEGIVVCLLREGESPLVVTEFRPFVAQETVSIGSQLSYLHVTTNMRMERKFASVLEQLCVLDKKILDARLQMIAGSNNPYALRDIFGVGVEVIRSGAVAYINKCAPVQVVLTEYTRNCTIEVPVVRAKTTKKRRDKRKADNSGEIKEEEQPEILFMDPISLILRKFPTEQQCSSINPIRWKLQGQWMCNSGTKPTECYPPQKLNTTIFKMPPEDYTRGLGDAIYSPTQRRQHRAFYDSYTARRAVVAHLTNAATFDYHAGGPTASRFRAPLSEDDLTAISDRVGYRFFPLFGWFHSAYHSLMEILIGIVVVKTIIGCIIRAVIVLRHRDRRDLTPWALLLWALGSFWTTIYHVFMIPKRLVVAAVDTGNRDPRDSSSDDDDDDDDVEGRGRPAHHRWRPSRPGPSPSPPGKGKAESYHAAFRKRFYQTFRRHGNPTDRRLNSSDYEEVQTQEMKNCDGAPTSNELSDPPVYTESSQPHYTAPPTQASGRVAVRRRSASQGSEMCPGRLVNGVLDPRF